MRKEEFNSNCDGFCTSGWEDISTIFTAHVACMLSASKLETIHSGHTSRIIVTDSEPSLEALEDSAVSA